MLRRVRDAVGIVLVVCVFALPTLGAVEKRAAAHTTRADQHRWGTPPGHHLVACSAMGTKVFISWSKARSKRIALALREWLPKILQTVDPFMSDKDIDAGKMWNAEVAKELDESSFGILCVTPENRDEPWLLFEAGAIAKRTTVSKVVPYLHGGLEFVHLIGSPLSSFQGAKSSDNKGTFDVVRSLNAETERPIPDDRLRETFDLWWPKLENAFTEADMESKEPAPKQPSEHDLLREILSITRRIYAQTLVGQVEVMRGVTHVPLSHARQNIGATRADSDKMRRPLGFKGEAQLRELITLYLKDPDEI